MSTKVVTTCTCGRAVRFVVPDGDKKAEMCDCCRGWEVIYKNGAWEVSQLELPNAHVTLAGVLGPPGGIGLNVS